MTDIMPRGMANLAVYFARPSIGSSAQYTYPLSAEGWCGRETAPQLVETAPQLVETAPQLVETAPQLAGATPQVWQTARQLGKRRAAPLMNAGV